MDDSLNRNDDWNDDMPIPSSFTAPKLQKPLVYENREDLLEQLKTELKKNSTNETNNTSNNPEVSRLVVALMLENSKEQIVENFQKYHERQVAARKAAYEEELKKFEDEEEAKKKIKEIKRIIDLPKDRSLIIQDVRTWLSTDNALTHQFLTETFSKNLSTYDAILQKVKHNEYEKQKSKNTHQGEIDFEDSLIDADDSNILELPNPIFEPEEIIGSNKPKNIFTRIWKTIKGWFNL